MSIQVEDYFARETFQKMKAFADKQETPFVVIDTAIETFGRTDDNVLAVDPLRSGAWRQVQHRREIDLE